MLFDMALLTSGHGSGREEALDEWEDRYRNNPGAGRNANCLLCLLSPTGDSPWNAYGWDVHKAQLDSACGTPDTDGMVSHEEAIA